MFHAGTVCWSAPAVKMRATAAPGERYEINFCPNIFSPDIFNGSGALHGSVCDRPNPSYFVAGTEF